MSRTPDEALRIALFHFEVVHDYSRGDLSSQLVLDAIAMRLAAGIEALNRLDEDHLTRLFGEWHGMWGMRNRIAHGYILVDSTLVTEAVVNELPAIVTAIRESLGQHDQHPASD